MKHRLLKRQIKKLLSPDFYESGMMDDFIEAINIAYKSYDSDYQQLERTLEISAKESFKELTDFKNAISTTSMLVITDYKEKIIFANENFIKASGYDKTEIIGKLNSDLNSDFHSAAFYKA